MKGKKTGGRRKGSGNKNNAVVLEGNTIVYITDLAKQYGREAIETLATIMRMEKAPVAVRVAASNSLLDRGYGKPSQAITGADGGPLIVEVLRLTDGEEVS